MIFLVEICDVVVFLKFDAVVVAFLVGFFLLQNFVKLGALCCANEEEEDGVMIFACFIL
jgi:hypothetical protein